MIEWFSWDLGYSKFGYSKFGYSMWITILGVEDNFYIIWNQARFQTCYRKGHSG